MIFDTHCHLNDEQLLNNIDEILLNAKKAGVDKFLVVGWDKESSIKAVELAERYDEIYAAVGFHPCNIFDISLDDIEFLKTLTKKKKVVAIGEIGLDYYWNKDPNERELQKEFFIKQIELANELNLPICVHNREAFEDCLNILKEHKPKCGGVMHCYAGSVESMKEVIDLGMYIGLGGVLTFTNAFKVKAVCEEVPLDKLVVETDSPYLAPHPLRGTVNEPRNVALVVDEVARIKNMSKKHLMDVLYKNSLELFKL